MNHLFIDNLTVIDFAYLDQHRGLVGESWIADIVLGGELDEQGMVFDFGNVKRTIKRVIDERVDHRLVVPASAACLQRDDNPGCLSWQLSDGSHIRHEGPEQSVVLLDHHEVVPSAVARLLENELKAVLPANVTAVEVTLREELIEGAYYHYVHGLKKHLGNCQRIAHGHRSPIRIDINSRHSPELEKHWARQWQDIYIGTREDMDQSWTDAGGTEYVSFRYDAEQGEFCLVLPRRRVWLLETDTTVELIAAYLADEIKKDYPADEVRVKAFEGVGKGAIAVR
ncbi:MAG: 6-pyruvoyl trahydropterin synthase family protein [Marinobacter sp.]